MNWKNEAIRWELLFIQCLYFQRPDKSRIVEEMMEVHGIKTDQNKSKIVEEIMEVDGLNAEEAKMPENSVPINGHNLPMEEDERMTNAKMIRLMAKEVDVEGRTPLLTACNYYMNYSSSTEEVEYKYTFLHWAPNSLLMHVTSVVYIYILFILIIIFSSF